MKKTLFFVAILTLALIAVYLFNSEDKSTLKTELSDFAVEDTGSITKLFLADKADNTVLLEKQENGSWLLNGKFLARQDAVNNLLYTIKEVKVRTPVPKSAFENIIKNIAGNSVKVEIYNGETDPSKVYYVGSSNQDHSGTYMLMENSTVPFVTHLEGHYGYLGPRYFTNENEWRSNAIFNYELDDIKMIEVFYPKDSERNIVIAQNEQGDFGLLNPEVDMFYANIDSAKFFRYINLFKNVSFEGFEETKTEAYKDSIINSDPEVIYAITNQLGIRKEVKAFLKPVPEGYEDYDGNEIKYDLDRLYAYIDNRDFVVIQYYVFDPLTKSRADFILR